MILLLSPSKTLNEKPRKTKAPLTVPAFLHESSILADILRKLSPRKLEELMEINPKLAMLNAERYQAWANPFPSGSAFPSILCFQGEVYNGLKASLLSDKDLVFAQEHLRILSGLYGVLRPLDLIMPYRLEMGTALQNPRGDDLYAFWGQAVNDHIAAEAMGKTLINLASDEYFRVINPSSFSRVIKCHFREENNGKLRFVTIFGKKARGLMARFAIVNRITNPEDLKAFDEENYLFNPDLSSVDEWYFTR